MIYVESEFARLRTVVLTQSEFGFPKKPRLGDLRFLQDDATYESLLHAGKDFREVYPELQLLWEAERLILKETLEQHDVRVLTPRKLTKNEKKCARDDGYANFFVRDPFFTIGNCVIEASLRFLHRRNEILPMRDIIYQEIYPKDCVYISAPRPEIGEKNDYGIGPFIEGGDVLVLGKHILVGSSGLATNYRGATWLGKFLQKYGYTIELVRLHPDILHLDCALGFVRNGLMVVCKEALLDGVPNVLKTWMPIEISLNEASALATNGLPISESVYITDPVFEYIGKQIEAEGIKVEYIDFAISRSFGGSFRCSTQPLWRKD
ncbi:MAG: hypothetical protein LBF27_34065 [Sphingobacterium sp.]|jgi:N-dimethylarginine dimethylaminohydrolase|nr:hypothetical protein [Sphingobacterium sp.]